MKGDHVNINVNVKVSMGTKQTAWLSCRSILGMPDRFAYSQTSHTAPNAATLRSVFLSIFMRESSYCFQRVLAIAILSVRPSVCPSVRRVDQSKTVQARITKSSPSGARKTLVLGTIKFFHKFERGHPERGRQMRGEWAKFAIFGQ